MFIYLSIEVASEAPAVENLVKEMELNCRRHMSSYDLPSVEAVIEKLDTLIQGEFVVKEQKRHLQGIFHIYLRTACLPQNIGPVDFEVRRRFKNEKNSISVPVT